MGVNARNTPSREELIGRAAELVPVLAKNALGQEENRVLHDDAVEALTQAGLPKMTLPARFGGYECGTTTT